MPRSGYPFAQADSRESDGKCIIGGVKAPYSVGDILIGPQVFNQIVARCYSAIAANQAAAYRAGHDVCRVRQIFKNPSAGVEGAKIVISAYADVARLILKKRCALVDDANKTPDPIHAQLGGPL